jgi:ABC-type lipoprotein export system ATPase subunit
MISLQDVSKTYRRRSEAVHALESVSLEAEPGDFVALRGPSGCGKSTLLLTLGGLLKPDNGQVIIGDADVYAVSKEARAKLRAHDLGFVFQQFHLVPYLNVKDNILAPALARSGDTARAEMLIERFGLSDRREHVPSELSTGERQRTALARALFNEPKVLLADEPTGNLDEANAAIVLDHLAAFAEDGGIVILVTHEEASAARAHRVLHMDAGRIHMPAL